MVYFDITLMCVTAFILYLAVTRSQKNEYNAVDYILMSLVCFVPIINIAMLAFCIVGTVLALIKEPR